MSNWIEREILDNAKRYNKGFNAGYEAGIKQGIKRAEEKEEEEEEEQSPAPDYNHNPEEVYFCK